MGLRYQPETKVRFKIPYGWGAIIAAAIKLWGGYDWDWVWVLSPAWIPGVVWASAQLVAAVIVLGITVGAAIMDILERVVNWVKTRNR